MGIRRGVVTGRRTPVPVQKLGRFKFWGAGPYANDQVSGMPFPKRYMVAQRGGLVVADWDYGTRDWSEPGDPPVSPVAQLAKPEPLYRVETPALLDLLTLDTTERDSFVALGYRWQVIGYSYPLGDEEPGLAKLYRSHHSGTGDYLHTTDAAEHAAALGAGYTLQVDNVYVFTATALNRRPIYRFYNSGTARHYYGMSVSDIGFLGSAWALQQIAFYAPLGAERTVS